jgi:hypothetical protein
MFDEHVEPRAGVAETSSDGEKLSVTNLYNRTYSPFSNFDLIIFYGLILLFFAFVFLFTPPLMWIVTIPVGIVGLVLGLILFFYRKRFI